MWHQIDPFVINIYAAAWLIENNTNSSKLPSGCYKNISSPLVNLYVEELPKLNGSTSNYLQKLYGVENNFDLPIEVLWALGYENYNDEKKKLKGIKKLKLEQNQNAN